MRKLLKIKKFIFITLSFIVTACDPIEQPIKPPTTPEEPKIEFSVEDNRIYFPAIPAESITVEVFSDYEWYYDNVADWITVVRDKNSLTITVPKFTQLYGYLSDLQYRSNNISIITFSDPEYSESLKIWQPHYYKTQDAVNSVLSSLDNIYLTFTEVPFSGNFEDCVFHYTGDDYPFEIAVEIKYEYQLGSPNRSWYSISGNNMTNLKLDGMIYMTNYYDSNWNLIYKAGAFKIDVKGSEFNHIFSYYPD